MRRAAWQARRPLPHRRAGSGKIAMTTMTEKLITIEDISAAAARIAGIAVKTPLVRARFEGVGGDVWLKAESLQPIGSFKLRGAANKILQLTREEIGRASCRERV